MCPNLEQLQNSLEVEQAMLVEMDFSNLNLLVCAAYHK